MKTSTKNETLQTAVNSKLDLTITKDDVILVLLVEEEKNLQSQVDELDKQIKALENVTSDEFIFSKIKEELKIDNDVDVSCGTLTYNGHTNKNLIIDYKLADINYLGTLTRINKTQIENRTYNRSMRLFTKDSLKLKLSKEIKTKDGFEGYLYKTLEYTYSAKLKKEIDIANKNRKKLVNLFVEKNNLQLNIITLDSNKELKASLIKKIVSQTDYNTFLLNA